LPSFILQDQNYAPYEDLSRSCVVFVFLLFFFLKPHSIL
jgi:hypothetical protein